MEQKGGAIVAQTQSTPEAQEQKVSQQQTIRNLFLGGMTRGEVAKKLGIRYQIVFKATNPKYAPKDQRTALVVRHNELLAAKAAALMAQIEEADEAEGDEA